MQRCPWCGDDPLYQEYHDTEWGVPEYDGRALWEKLCLDGFQAGLSWLTILRKRENFRTAFKGFDPAEIASWGEEEVLALLQNPGIIRHRGKIEATIQGARVWLRIEQTQGFSDFLWRYVDGTPLQPRYSAQSQVPTKNELSERLSADLRAQGFKFCGPTITYAFLEAAGLINDHLTCCHRHSHLDPA